MSNYIRPIVVGAVVAFVIGFGLAFTFAVLGAPHTGLSIYCGVFIGGFTGYIMANLAGNRKVATADAAGRAWALAMTPSAGKALLYVYREGFVGKAAGMNITVDDQPLAQLTSPRFTCIAAPPGAHSVSAAFGGLAASQNKIALESFSVAAGDVRAFRVTLSMGMTQNSIKLTLMPDLAAVKTALGRMKMTVADKAEV